MGNSKLIQTSLTMPEYPETTIWIWPTGLFPRILIYYLRSKSLTIRDLLAYNIHLNTISLDSAIHQLVVRPGDEDRPAGTTLPCARIKPIGNSEKPYLIRETDGILAHLEGVLGVSAGFPSAFGNTAKQRARVFDIISVLHEATTWFGLYIVNSDPASLSWSGLAREKWSEGTAEYAKRKHGALLGKLEGWIDEDEVGDKSEATVAGFMLMAVVEYTRQGSGRDWVEGHEVLRRWCEGMKEEKWWIGIKGLARMETEGLKDCGVMFEGEPKPETQRDQVDGELQ